MLGFPNQISNLNKLALAAEVFHQAHIDGIDLKSDYHVGEMLLAHQVISPRNKKITLKQYLIEQRKKKRSDRSYEASTRGLRELLLYFGILELDGENCLFGNILPSELYNSQTGEIEQPHAKKWGQLFNNITLGDNDVHPYRVLLRLVEKLPGINRKISTLCFAATDDSEAELDKIVQLAQYIQNLAESESEERNLEDIIADELDEKPSNVNNAAKILPSFAIQIGELEIDNEHNLYPVQMKKKHEATNTLQKKKNGKSSRKVNSDEIAQAGIHSSSADIDQMPEYFDSAEKMKEAIILRKDRLKRHNIIVKEIAKIFEEKGFTLYEDPYDCLALKNGKAYIIEVKTLSGEARDEVEQVRAAFSQLKYYESFSDTYEAEELILAAVFESQISSSHDEWLNGNGINVASINFFKENFDKIIGQDLLIA